MGRLRFLLFTLGAASALLAEGQPAAYFETPLFVAGQGGYAAYRIPAIVRTTNGTLLAFCEGRKTSAGDSGDIDIVLRRSTDNGQSWGPMSLVQEEGGTATITIGNPAPVVDEMTGNIHLLFCRNNDRVFHTVSTDDGVTWSVRTEITSTVKLGTWSWYATGPLHGIQLKRGEQASRLVVPCDHQIAGSGAYGAQGVYSDDHGVTWQLGAVGDSINGVNPNETACVELVSPAANGGSRLYFNSRDHNGSAAGTRAEAWSTNGGLSFTRFTNRVSFVCPVVEGSLLRLRATDEGAGTNRLLFSCPNDSSSRVNLSIWSSTDEAASWGAPKLICGGPSAYSDMARTTGGEVALLYEQGVASAYETVTFGRFNEAWLDQPPAPPTDPGASVLAALYQAGTNGSPTAPDPISAGGASWTRVDPASDSSHFAYGGLSPDRTNNPGNLNAWRVLDNSTTSSAFLYYGKDLTPLQVACAKRFGWKATIYMRAADPAGSGGGGDCVLFLFTYGDGTLRYPVFFTQTATNTLRVNFQTGSGAGGQQYLVSNATQAAGYNLVELTCGPSSPVVTGYVNGLLATTNWPGRTGVADAADELEVRWGTQSSGGRGDGYFNLVRFEIYGGMRLGVMENPQSTTNQVGAAVTFTAVFTNVPAMVQWYKDGSPIVRATNYSIVTTGPLAPSAVSTFEIDSAAAEDEGSYYCQAANLANSTNTQPAYLRVMPAPPVITVRTQGNNIEIHFTGVLQASTNVGWGYMDVPGDPASPLLVTPGDPFSQQFFRCRNL